MKLLLYFHNFLYKLISYLAIKKEGLHPKHRLMNYHQFFIDNIRKKDTVIDMGCGNGALTIDLAKKAKRVIGMDLVDNFPLPGKNYSFRIADITKEVYGSGCVVILSNVLEHIEDRKSFLHFIKGDKILVRVPMLNRDWLTLYKKELGVEYRLDKGHFIEYTEESFRQEVKEAGLRIVRLEIRFGEIYAICK